MRYIKILFCRHKWQFIRKLYGDEINMHKGKRNEHKCHKCGMYKWD